jgi:hypothetical protein
MKSIRFGSSAERFRNERTEPVWAIADLRAQSHEDLVKFVARQTRGVAGGERSPPFSHVRTGYRARPAYPVGAAN